MIPDWFVWGPSRSPSRNPTRSPSRDPTRSPSRNPTRSNFQNQFEEMKFCFLFSDIDNVEFCMCLMSNYNLFHFVWGPTKGKNLKKIFSETNCLFCCLSNRILFFQKIECNKYPNCHIIAPPFEFPSCLREGTIIWTIRVQLFFVY